MMDLLIIFGYVLGALITNFIIYKDVEETELEYQSANIASILWPLALVLLLVITIESWIKKFLP